MKLKPLACLALSAAILFSTQSGPAAALGSSFVRNPFVSLDKEREERLTESSGKYVPAAKALAADEKEKAGSDKETGISSIIKFKSTVTLGDIEALLSPYDYELIGSSANRLFKVKSASLEQVKAAFQGKYQYVEQDRVSKLQMTTNDPKLPEQWALNKTKINDAWEISKGSPDVVVAMIDTGIYREHEDLAGVNIAEGHDYITGGKADRDVYGHGTMTTGVIAAAANNGIGISGACWNVKIIPLQVFDESGGAETSTICDAIYDAVEMGADIINMSLGGYFTSKAMADAVANAISHGCIVVAAAGNESAPDYLYPASYDGVISCSSIDSNLKPSYFTTYNDKVDVASPGEDILCISADGPDSYESVDGTSFSSPYVAGIAALAKACDDSLNASTFERILKATSTDLGDKGFDDYYGHGVVNADKVLKYVKDMKTKDFIIQDGVLVDYLGSGGNITIPEGVTSIRSEAFYNCSALQSVVIPSSVKSIESRAFYLCENLKEVTIPKTVTAIGKDAFGKTPWLADYPEDFVVAGNDILIGYTGISTNVKIPGNVKSISDYAFYANNAIKSVTIPSSVTSIGDFAFYGYQKNGDLNSLASVSIPNSVKSIGYRAFTGTPWLEENPQDFVVAGDYILVQYNGDGGSVTIPADIKSIGTGAFEACRGLSSINFCRGTVSIGDKAFLDCEDLANVTLSGSITTIGSSAFNDCYSLENIVIPKNVTVFGDNAFDNCRRIKFTCTPGSPAAAYADKNVLPVINIDAVEKLYLDTSSLVWVYGKNGALSVSVDPGYATNTAVNWASSNPKVATVDNTGFVKAVGFGTATITCTADDGNGAKATCSVKVIPSTPVAIKTACTSYSSVKINWNAVPGADGYEVYRYSPMAETYVLIKDLTSTNYTNTGLQTDKTYSYKVRAYKKSGSIKIYSGFTSSVSGKPVLSAPASFTAAKASKTALKLSWSPVAGANGYAVYRYSYDTDRYSVLATTYSTAFTNSSLTGKYTYYYKVRAFRTVNGQKIYGAYSVIKYIAL